MPTSSKFTTARMKKVSKRLNGIYKQASEELTEKVNSFFADFERLDKQKIKLVESGKMSEREYKEWRKNKLLMGKKYEDLRDTMVERMTKADEIATAYMNGELPAVYAHNFNQVGKDAEAIVKGYSFDLVNEDAVRKLSTSDKTLLPYKIVDGRRTERWHTKRVNSAILQGILQGEGSKKIAKRLMETAEMGKVSAMRNARTALTGAQNKGREDAMGRLAKAGLPIRKKWMASTGDGRTRPAHLELHEVSVPWDKPFENAIGRIMYPGDPNAHPSNVYNCRCSLVTDFSELLQEEEEEEILSEEEIKEQEYQELAAQQKEIKHRLDEADSRNYRLSDEKRDLKEMVQLLESNQDEYKKYDKFDSFDDYRDFVRMKIEESQKLDDEIREFRRKWREKEHPTDADFEEYQKKLQSLRKQKDEVDQVIYAPYPDWDKVELYRKAKSMGIDKVQERLSKIDDEIKIAKEQQDKISKEWEAIRRKIIHDYPIQDFVADMEKKKVEYRNPVKRNVDDIVSRIAGGDMTKGSCASLAFCYAAQKSGYDVLDFRDGASREEISIRVHGILDYFGRKYEGSLKTQTAQTDTTAGHKLLLKSDMELGKEYYFTCGRHAAIVRKTQYDRMTYIEYLELQSSNWNGWTPFAEESDKTAMDFTLSYRFAAGKTVASSGFDPSAMLFDIDRLKNDPEFIKMMGYINTAENEQVKGSEGHER